MARSTASDKRAAQGAGKGRDAGVVQAIHHRWVEIVYPRHRAQHDRITELVDIYATLNRIRVLSSPKVIAEADKALRMIVDTYAKENTTFSGIRQSIGHGFPDPLRTFSEACHEELKMD
jgi:hypothetical protein